jgi:hypothetical protein
MDWTAIGKEPISKIILTLRDLQVETAQWKGLRKIDKALPG